MERFFKQFLHLQLRVDKTFFSDEAHFKLNGRVNNKICAISRLIIQLGRLQNHCFLNRLLCGAPFHSTTSSDFFFNYENRHTIRINSVWYDEMLRTFLFDIEDTLSHSKTNMVSIGCGHSICYQSGHSVFKTKIR